MQAKNIKLKVITYSYVYCYLLFQVQKHRSHIMVAKLSVISAATFIVGEG